MGGVLLSGEVHIGWRPSCSVSTDADADLISVGDGVRTARIGTGTELRRAVVDLLAAGDRTVDRLVEESARVAEPAEVLHAQIEARSLLAALAGRGLLGSRLVDESGVAATIAIDRLPDEPLAPCSSIVLAADVFLRRADGDSPAGSDLVLEAADDPGRCDVVTAGFGAALLRLAVPTAADSVPLAPSWLDVLRHARVLTDATSEPPGRSPWEFHDRLFHTRSRLWGGLQRPYGVTMRLQGETTPRPAFDVPAGANGTPVRLVAPAEADRPAPFVDVAERRRSRRRPTGALTVAQLGELLWRIARVRASRASPAGDEIDRPVPSGGGLGAVRVHALVEDCDGLGRGLYHYDDDVHALRRFEDAPPDALDRLAAGARLTAGLDDDDPLQVVLVLTARFERLQYKYSAMGYAVALKDVGVLFQSLYLTAEAIGIGGCALGGGDSVVFERASGIDRWTEGSVGEFLLVGVGADS